jgi:hypothetical protein
LILLHRLVILPYFYQPAEAARQFIRFPVTEPAFASSCRRFACDQRSSIRLFLARGYSGWPATENAIQGYTGEIAMAAVASSRQSGRAATTRLSVAELPHERAEFANVECGSDLGR